MSRSKKSNKKLVKQANALTTAAYSLSRVEKRLVYMGLSSLMANPIKANELGQYQVDIRHVQYRSLFQDSLTNVSRDISTAAKNLNRREVVFYVPDKDGEGDDKAEDGLSWTTKRSHRPADGVTSIYFNKELIDIILNSEASYTKFLLSEAGMLSNAHYMRLFESLSQWSNNKDGKVTFSVDWMMERYELPKSYSRMSDFRRRFLHPAVAEINAETSLSVTFEEIKDPDNPKRVKHVRFFYDKSVSRDRLNQGKADDALKPKRLGNGELFSFDDAVNVYVALMANQSVSREELDMFAKFIPELIRNNYGIDGDFFQVFKAAKELAGVDS